MSKIVSYYTLGPVAGDNLLDLPESLFVAPTHSKTMYLTNQLLPVYIRTMSDSSSVRSKAQAATVAILETADLLRRRFSEALEPEGVTLQQYNVLRILRTAKGPLPTLDIATRLIEQTPGITRLLDRLDRKGLVRRERDPGDRRIVNCWITLAGEQLLTRLEPAIDAIDDLPFESFEPDEVEAFVEMLEAVAIAIQ